MSDEIERAKSLMPESGTLPEAIKTKINTLCLISIAESLEQLCFLQQSRRE